MNILPKEVESIKIIGRLFDSDVKLVKTFGGFNLAIGKKNKNSREAEALAGGSHSGIVAHQLSKEYGSDFHPAIFKSEQDQLEKVEEKSQYLPSDQIQRGLELFTLSKGNSIKFVLHRYGVTLGEYKTEVSNDSLLIKSYKFDNSMVKFNKQTAEAVSRAMRDKAYDLNLSKIVQK